MAAPVARLVPERPERPGGRVQVSCLPRAATKEQRLQQAPEQRPVVATAAAAVVVVVDAPDRETTSSKQVRLTRPRLTAPVERLEQAALATRSRARTERLARQERRALQAAAEAEEEAEAAAAAVELPAEPALLAALVGLDLPAYSSSNIGSDLKCAWPLSRTMSCRT